MDWGSNLDLGLLSGGVLFSSVGLLSLFVLLLGVGSRHDLGLSFLVSLVKTFISIDLLSNKRINKIAFNLQIRFLSQLSWFLLVVSTLNGKLNASEGCKILTLFFPIFVKVFVF
jgi:hypothetical protein